MAATADYRPPPIPQLQPQSPFLSPTAHSQPSELGILHLRREQSVPVILSSSASAPAASKGYAEGLVINTRFGAFPHSTLVNIPWGSQVRASKVDTGSRGRKRNIQDVSTPSDNGDEGDERKQAVSASSGFAYLLPPTPENWTTSLPHRTQVVYTPDYAYILHRIRARPGSVLIEAGSGSGSFTHAAARAVFSGYPPPVEEHDGERCVRMETGSNTCHELPFGRVFSFEFHEGRFQKVQEEMRQHNLDSIVTCTHCDVYKNGFLLSPTTSDLPFVSPNATSIFLDLPAPWQALPHLSRKQPSALDPSSPVHICTFSPCIEQGQRTVSALRRHGWLHIEMVELAHRRLEIRRDHTGLEYEGMRGANVVAADVGQAVARLKEVEKKIREYHRRTESADGTAGVADMKMEDMDSMQSQKTGGKAPWKEGRLLHRTESELKTHTSYLVFAILPQDWTEEDEMRAQAEWANAKSTSSKMSKRQEARDAKEKLQKVDSGVGASVTPNEPEKIVST